MFLHILATFCYYIANMVRRTESEIKEKLKKFGFEKAERLESKKDVYVDTDYPHPVRTFRIEYEAENYNVEEMYYWIIGHLHYDFGMTDVVKIIDTHAHSAGSALFGDLQARLGAQQSNVSNYMGMMGRLIKDLFGLVRELRQLEERLGYYVVTEGMLPGQKEVTIDGKKVTAEEFGKLKFDPDRKNSAEASLKDVWITLVEGGSQNPSSVFGMAQKVGFTILPDLFFAAGPMKKEQVDKYIDGLEFNDSVKGALRRKLFQFLIWKEETYKELYNKRSFQIRYLRQHYEVIKMYMEWIKPYLRNIQRLNQNESRMEEDAFLIHSFDASVSEIEVALCKPDKIKTCDLDEYKVGEAGSEKIYKKGDIIREESTYGVVLINFTFHTKPQILIRAPESYQQKGAVHTGHVDMIMRCYGWTGENIDKYKEYRDSQAWDFIQTFDKSISDAMDYLGDDLKRYMEEAGSKLPELIPKKPESKEKKKEETPNQFKETLGFIGGPFNGIVELLDPLLGISNIFGLFKSDPKDKDAEKKKELKDALKDAEKGSLFNGYQAYKNYKKAHRMTHW